MSNPTIIPKNIQTRLERAISGRDSVAYCNLCDQYGLEITLPDLYEMGQAELISKQCPTPGTSVLEETIEKYGDFFKKAGSFKTDIFDNPLAKSALIQKYFPKFRADGSQPIDNYTNPQIGHLFNILYQQAKRIIKNKHE